ncbi:MAG: phosphate signaling complex protein PhoU [Treponema sp.]|jgi:phosphate transport system protein|nr:phosphate signaling complex protein PhoU [Treponema sp.]
MQTRSLLNEELDKVRRELTLMATMVEEDIGKALAMVRSGDEELAREVKESGKAVDALQLKIENMALVLIATQQPVASDLREMVMVFKIAASLERINDYSIHLVKIAKKLSGRPAFRSLERVERMVETAQAMLKAAFSAYLAKNVDAARKAALMDDLIDVEHKALVDEVLSFMKENRKLVKAASRLLRLSGYMERLGDHITNICEAISYMVRGRHEKLNE